MRKEDARVVEQPGGGEAESADQDRDQGSDQGVTRTRSPVHRSLEEEQRLLLSEATGFYRQKLNEAGWSYEADSLDVGERGLRASRGEQGVLVELEQEGELVEIELELDAR